MTENRLLTFTYITNFRGGTYCTQVEAESINKSLSSWIEKLKLEKKEIQYLGDKIIEELENVIGEKDNQPTPLTGLINVWFGFYTTKQGRFNINIIQTEIENN